MFPAAYNALKFIERKYSRSAGSFEESIHKEQITAVQLSLVHTASGLDKEEPEIHCRIEQNG